MSVAIFGEGAMREEKYPGVNQREKQTYYGAVNYLTKQFVLREYATANSENTVAF